MAKIPFKKVWPNYLSKRYGQNTFQKGMAKPLSQTFYQPFRPKVLKRFGHTFLKGILKGINTSVLPDLYANISLKNKTISYRLLRLNQA
jgi:hypothetical protein